MKINFENQKARTVIALTAFLLAGSSLFLAFKDKSVLARADLRGQLQAASKNFSAENDASGAAALYARDLDAISKSSGIPKDTLSKFLDAVRSGSASCLSTVGSVTVSHSLCKPPGRGKWTKQPDKPGTDLRPCPVTGTQGGSVTAICLGGCCRALSASSPQSALGGMSGMGGMLAQMLPQFLQQMMQSGGGGGGSYDYNYDSGNFDGGYDGVYGSTGSSSITTDFDDYTNFDPGVELDAGTSVSNTGTIAKGGTQSAENKQDGADSDTLETLLLKNENQATTSSSTSEQAQNTLVRPASVPSTTDSGSNEIEEINRSNIYNFEFQNIKKEKQDEKKVANLRDPDSSSVRGFVKKINKESDENSAYEFESVQRSWWQRLLDWILGD